MSTGETPPSATARFTSPININNSGANKKYPNTPKSPMLNTSTPVNRNLQAKQKLLGSKVSAPRPFNLPSLKQEQKVGTEIPASSPSGSHGWGSSSSSPSTSFTQPSEIHMKIGSPEENGLTSAPNKAADSSHSAIATTTTQAVAESTTTPATIKADPESSSPPLNTTVTPTIRGWAVPTVTATTIQPPSTDFPTAAEAAGKKKPSILDDKEYLKYASSDPNHTSWDEMVSEDLDDFSVDVVEFDDGTKVQVMDENDDLTSNTVLPSDRFTDDYDRSYPPKHTTTDYHYTGGYKPSYRRSEDHGYSARYNNSVHGSYDNRRHSATDDKHPSSDGRWTSRRDSVDNINNSSTTWSTNNNRRSSYDKKSTAPYHPTLLQRPRRLSEQSFTSSHSHHSREDQDHHHHLTNPLQIIPEPSTSQPMNEVAAEITAAQREVMLTAAERAKKRRDEEEAEFEAARVRARQKADALAEKARVGKLEKEAKETKEKPKKESPTITIEKKPFANDLEKKSNKTNKSVEKKESKRYSESSVTSKPPQKLFEPSLLPGTSKPWNLVAAKKEAPVAIEKEAAAVPPVTSAFPASVATFKKESDEATKDVKPDAAVVSKESTAEDSATTAPAKETTSAIDEKKEAPVIPTVDRNGKPLTEDEKNWEVYVSKIKTNSTVPIPVADVTPSVWSSFATRLQKEDDEKHAAFVAKQNAKAEEIVEELEFKNNEDWGIIPQHITQGRGQDRGWTRNEEDHSGYRNGRGRGRGMSERGRGRGERSDRGRGAGRNFIDSNGARQHFESANNDYWRQPSNENTSNEQKPVVMEILKKEPVVEQPKESPAQIKEPPSQQVNEASKKTRLTNMLKESSSPIFPDFIEKLAGRKPANMSFMVDVDESDNDITMMDQPAIVTQAEVIVEKPAEVVDTTEEKSEAATFGAEKESVNVPETVDETSATSSTASTPPRAQFNDHSKSKSSSPQRFNANPNFPVLIYQYPISQQLQEENNNQTNGLNGMNNQRPLGLYLMPQQQYLSSNQYMVPYPQAATGVHPIYFPALPWQQQQHQSPRSHHDQRRPYNNSHFNKPYPAKYHSHEWESLPNSNGYHSHRYNSAHYQRGNFNHKHGSWSNSGHVLRGRGRGSHSYHSSKRYQDANGDTPTHQQESALSVDASL